jgi:predicted PurR-regulated permease PerM
MNNVTGNSSILKVVLIWAGVAIIIIAMKMSATILSSFLLAGVIGISVLHVTSWLIRKGVATWLALLITIGLVFLGVVALIAVIAISVVNLVETLPKYQSNLQGLLDSAATGLSSLGLQQTDLEPAIAQTGRAAQCTVS